MLHRQGSCCSCKHGHEGHQTVAEDEEKARKKQGSSFTRGDGTFDSHRLGHP